MPSSLTTSDSLNSWSGRETSRAMTEMTRPVGGETLLRAPLLWLDSARDIRTNTLVDGDKPLSHRAPCGCPGRSPFGDGRGSLGVARACPGRAKCFEYTTKVV